MKEALLTTFKAIAYAVMLILRSLGPAALARSVWRLATRWLGGTRRHDEGRTPLPRRLLDLYLTLEGIWWAWCRVYLGPRSRVSRDARPQEPLPSQAQRRVLFDRCLRTTHLQDGGGGGARWRWLSAWFFGANPETLSRRSIARFLAYGFFAKLPEIEDGPNAMTAADTREVDTMIADIEQNLRESDQEARRFTKFVFKDDDAAAADGSPPAPMLNTFTRDPVEWQHRPLLVYAVTHLLVNSCATPVALRCMGFARRATATARCGGSRLVYWHWQSPTVDRDTLVTPIVFVHGLGVGLLPYLAFVRDLQRRLASPEHAASSGARALVLIEFEAVAGKMFAPCPTRREMVDAVDEILLEHKYATCAFVGHSFGTVPTAWLAVDLAPRCVACAFLDPACFLVHHVNVLRSICFNVDETVGDELTSYYIRHEYFMQAYLRRYFWWWQNILFAEELPAPTLVVVSGGDDIVPAAAVERYFAELPNTEHHVLREDGSTSVLSQRHFPVTPPSLRGKVGRLSPPPGSPWAIGGDFNVSPRASGKSFFDRSFSDGESSEGEGGQRAPPPIDLLTLENLVHGNFLFSGTARDAIWERLRRIL